LQLRRHDAVLSGPQPQAQQCVRMNEQTFVQFLHGNLVKTQWCGLGGEHLAPQLVH